MANAHPAGAKPFKRADYVRKFDLLTEAIITREERNRFIQLVENLPDLKAKDLKDLNVQIALDKMIYNKRDTRGIF